MKKCLHASVLLLESAVLLWVLSHVAFAVLPDCFISSQRSFHLNFMFLNPSDRDFVRDVQVFFQTRSISKWFANEKYGQPIVLSQAPQDLTFEVPRAARFIRIDFHFKKDIPLPTDVPALDAMEISGCKLDSNALEEFRAEPYHTLCREGALPCSLMYTMWEFWLLFAGLYSMVGGCILFFCFARRA